MKEQDLINKLENYFDKVLQNQKAKGSEEGALENWGIPVYDLSTDTANRKWIKYYKDTNTEDVYWQHNDPTRKPTPTTSWREEVKQYLLQKQSEGIIKEGSIERSNDDQRTAIVDVTLENSGTFSMQKFLIDEDSNKNLQYHSIG